MKATNFAYWLQGYFELNGSDASLTEKQAKNLLQKAESVTRGQDKAEEQAQGFVEYTKGALLAVKQGVATPALLNMVTNELKTKLNDLFIHAIDPTVPGDQQQHRKTHRPGNDGPRLEPMC